MKEEEKEVIKRALSGDQEAYSLILRSYRDAVFGLVYRMTSPRRHSSGPSNPSAIIHPSTLSLPGSLELLPTDALIT